MPTTTEKATPRLDWVDYAKGIGIFFVVLGHSLKGLSKSYILPETSWSLGLEHWIYSFHMPLFFILAGLFVERSLRKPLKQLLLDKFLVLGYPYFLWSIVQGLLQVATSGQTNTEVTLADIPKIIYAPIQQFWFLYVLFVVFALYTLARKKHVPMSICFLVSILGYVIASAHLLPSQWFVLRLTLNECIFFIMGAWWGSRPISNALVKRSIPQLGLIGLAGYGFVTLTIVQGWEMLPWVRFMDAIAGTLASVALAIIFDRQKFLGFIRQWGILSLEIFAAHTIVSAMLRVLLYKGFHIDQPLLHLSLSVVIGLYGPILLDRASRLLKFPYLFALKPRH
jgi:fucose 4-O-acetylase-like acetyltransferase